MSVIIQLLQIIIILSFSCCVKADKSAIKFRDNDQESVTYTTSLDSSDTHINIEPSIDVILNKFIASGLTDTLFEGDMKVTYDQIESEFGKDYADAMVSAGKIYDNPTHVRALSMVKNKQLLWPTRDQNNKVVVPYAIGGSFSQETKNLIVQSLNALSSLVKVVVFIPRTTESDYINFLNNNEGCWSVVGRATGAQTINIGPGCEYNSVIQHETMHALGFYHEQSRLDRDDYITINWDNILIGKENEFQKQDSQSLGVSYDYQSVMHYGEHTFSKRGATCSKAPQSCNVVYTLMYRGNGVDGSNVHCVDVPSGYSALNSFQGIALTPCGTQNYLNQYWIFENYDNSSVLIKLARDPSYCLTVNYRSTSLGADTIINKCSTTGVSPYRYQRFQLHGNSWSNMFIRWDPDNNYCLSRIFDASTPSSGNVPLITYTCSDPDDRYAIISTPKETGFCESVNTFCSATANDLVTMDGRGHPLGNTQASESDIVKTQLLYKCSSGPRNISAFCSPDCLCSEGQGQCKDDLGCESHLACQYDGISMKRCLPGTRTPTTLSPSKAPTTPAPTKAPTFKPTNNPTLVPTIKPSSSPTLTPTPRPTTDPTLRPTKSPTDKPTMKPSKSPSMKRQRKTKSPTIGPTSPTQSPTATCNTDNVSMDCGCSYNITVIRGNCPAQNIYVCSKDSSFKSVKLGTKEYCDDFPYMASLWGEGLCGNDPSKSHLLAFSTGKSVLYITKMLKKGFFSTIPVKGKILFGGIGKMTKWALDKKNYMKPNNRKCPVLKWALAPSPSVGTGVVLATESYAQLDYGCSCASIKD